MQYGAITDVQVIINGESKEFDEAVTVSELLSMLELSSKKIAVERNLAIVPKSAYGDTQVADGDHIEIVQFVGGG